MSSPTVAKKFTVRLSREAFEWVDVEIVAPDNDEAESVALQALEDGEFPDLRWQLSIGDSTPYVTDSWEVGE